MARKAVSCTVQARLGNGVALLTNHGQPADPINASTTAADVATAEAVVVLLEADTGAAVESAIADIETDVSALDAAVTAVEAAVATLEADGASPTQAHVTALRGVWDTLVALIPPGAENTAVESDVGVLEADVATPTQAHVNDLRGTWDALNATITYPGVVTAARAAWDAFIGDLGTDVGDARTAWDAVVADVAAVPAVADVVVSYNASTVVSRDTLRQAIDQLLNTLPLTL